jgi:hypothetical protein
MYRRRSGWSRDRRGALTERHPRGMPERSAGRSLTRREFDAVIRRAAELAGSDPEGSEGAVSEGELFRIAGEVGLPESHVRRALAEVRSGEVGGGRIDRLFGPALVAASRVVPGEPDAIALEIDEFLVATQLLQRVRRTVDVLQYRPAVDWTSQLARAASFSSRKYYIASAKSVEVRMERVDEGRTLVEFLVDPGTRNEDVAGAVFGGGAAGVATGVVLGALIASAAPLAVGVGVGVLVGGGVWTGTAIAVGRGHRKKVVDVRTEIEGVLDALERGASLEPPPPSWRRWVKRHFHGVARDLMGSDET